MTASIPFRTFFIITGDCQHPCYFNHTHTHTHTYVAHSFGPELVLCNVYGIIIKIEVVQKKVHKQACIYYTYQNKTLRPRHNSKPVCLWHRFLVPKKLLKHSHTDYIYIYEDKTRCSKQSAGSMFLCQGFLV